VPGRVAPRARPLPLAPRELPAAVPAPAQGSLGGLTPPLPVAASVLRRLLQAGPSARHLPAAALEGRREVELMATCGCCCGGGRERGLGRGDRTAAAGPSRWRCFVRSKYGTKTMLLLRRIRPGVVGGTGEEEGRPLNV